MITIPVKVCGDVWCDSEAFQQTLSCVDPHDDIMIDMKAEGVSLGALGVLDVLDQYCASTGRDPATIQLINSPNNIESSAFRNTHVGISHFFPMCVRYWEPLRPVCALSNRFAMFVGRGTVARCVMMYELNHDAFLRNHFLFSTMAYKGKPIWQPYDGWHVVENFEQWLPQDLIEDLHQWWLTQRPPSLDDKNVVDQYDPNHNTNQSLLKTYGRFNVEVVAETYTLGTTFFPTEKTVRPIMAAKPWLIYGPINFVKHLKAMGFISYGDLWDESYDQNEGPERWKKMKTVIHRLCKMNADDFGIIMDRAHDIAVHNRRILADLVLTHKAHAIQQAGIA